MRRALSLIGYAAIAACLSAHAVTARGAETCARDRILGIAELWSQVRWHHVALPDSNVDWEEQLAKQLPKLCSSQGQQLKQSLDDMMAPLKDPFYRAYDPKQRSLVKWVQPSGTLVDWAPGDVALLHLHQGVALSRMDGTLDPRIDQAIAEIRRKATALLVDLRPVNASEIVDGLALEAIVSHLVQREITLPAQRSLLRADFRVEGESLVEGRFSGAFLASSRVVSPQKDPKPMRIGFIANADTNLPPVALALQQAGLGWVFSESGTSPPRASPTRVVAISPDISVRFSIGQYVYADGTAGHRVDMQVSSQALSTGGSIEVTKAAELLKQGVATAPGVYQPIGLILPIRPAPLRREMNPPDLQWRRLATIKYWSTVNAVTPRQQQVPKDLRDEAMTSAFSLMGDATTSDAYVRVLAGMTSTFKDSHTRVMGRLARNTFGDAGIPIRVKLVEDKYLITDILSKELKSVGSVAIGDELLQVNGRPVASLVLDRLALVSASTPTAGERDGLSGLFQGKAGSRLALKVSSNAGVISDVTLEFGRPEEHPADAAPAYRPLGEGVGYVDLSRLQLSQVDDMFKQLGTSKALVFDLRGYPNGTGWAIARRLNVSGRATQGPSFVGNLVDASLESKSISFGQEVEAPDGKPFGGRVVVLVDGRTQSQGEHTVLLFETVAPVITVGEPTAGADGDIAADVLPGGVFISMTGFDVRRSDGTAIQRIGIQPDVLVRQSVAGVRSGRDEQLDAALKLLQ